jgi:hypothetical protein
MKKWITIPISIIATILPGCGTENENESKKEAKSTISENAEVKDSLSLISGEKEPSDCGFSNSLNK